jgi:hypothetical protein
VVVSNFRPVYSTIGVNIAESREVGVESGEFENPSMDAAILVLDVGE